MFEVKIGQNSSRLYKKSSTPPKKNHQKVIFSEKDFFEEIFKKKMEEDFFWGRKEFSPENYKKINMSYVMKSLVICVVLRIISALSNGKKQKKTNLWWLYASLSCIYVNIRTITIRVLSRRFNLHTIECF